MRIVIEDSRLGDQDVYSILGKVWGQDCDPEVLRDLSNCASPVVRIAVAESTRTHADELEGLVADCDWRVRYTAALNPSTSMPALAKLIQSADLLVASAVLDNPACSQTLRDMAAQRNVPNPSGWWNYEEFGSRSANPLRRYGDFDDYECVHDWAFACYNQLDFPAGEPASWSLDQWRAILNAITAGYGGSAAALGVDEYEIQRMLATRTLTAEDTQMLIDLDWSRIPRNAVITDIQSVPTLSLVAEQDQATEPQLDIAYSALFKDAPGQERFHEQLLAIVRHRAAGAGLIAKITDDAVAGTGALEFLEDYWDIDDYLEQFWRPLIASLLASPHLTTEMKVQLLSAEPPMPGHDDG